MEKVHRYEHDAQYYETDKMGVVHHSNYIRWFEEARVDFMKKSGLPYDKMEESGIMMPVLGVDCKYHSSVRFGERVVIETAVTLFKGVKVELRYAVRDKGTGELRTTGSSSHCFTDTGLKPVRIQKIFPEIAEKFAELVTDEL